LVNPAFTAARNPFLIAVASATKIDAAPR